MFRSGLLLGGGNATAALLGLVRNIAIARLISVEDFGIASTFAITMAMVEMASNMSLDRLLVQARDGENQGLLSTLHAIQAARGLLGATLLFLLAGPLASLFGVPDVAWAYQALALVPLLRGLAHLDMFRRQRELQFFPSVAVEVSAQLAATAAALPLALALGDYRAMLYVLLIQQVVFSLVSHGLAVRPYRWAWNGEVVRRALIFGWPLLLDTVLMFGIVQGERLVVGTLIGMVELGWFSVAFALTLVPATVAAKILQLFFLPQLSRVQDNAHEFERLYVVTMQASMLVGVAISVAFAVIGPTMLIALYGWKYEPAAPILVWLAVLHGLRAARGGASIVAISKGYTTNPLIANVARVLALPVAALLVSAGAGILTLLGVAIAGEVLALVLSLGLLRRRLALPLSGLGIPFAASMVCITMVGAGAYARTAQNASWALELGPVGLVMLALVVLWSMRELRAWSRTVFSQT